MILRSRRKLQTTRPSSRLWKNIRIEPKALASGDPGTTSKAASFDANAFGSVMPGFVIAITLVLLHAYPTLLTADDFGWGGGRLPAHAELVDREFDAVDTASSDFAPDDAMASESARMAAAWEEDDALAAELQEAPEEFATEAPEGETPGTVLNRSDADRLHTVDPFDADDRFAQLPNDPFDEPSGETIPELEQRPNLDAVENALDREMERREAEVDQRAGESDEPAVDEEVVEESADTERSQVGEGAPRNDLNFQLQTPQRPAGETVEPFRRGIGTTPAEEAAQSQQSCEEELAALKADRISTVDLSIRIDGVAGEDFPYECPLGDEQLQPRVWPEITYTWKASALCHKPLYFEDVQLERYGHSWPRCAQPIMSGAHFFGSMAILPYKMGLQTPNECVYALGHYRPGSCAPYYIEALPFTWRAAAFQTGVITGIHFALP